MGTRDGKMYRREWKPDDFVISANRKLIHSACTGEPWMAAADRSRLYHLAFLDTREPVRAAVQTSNGPSCYCICKNISCVLEVSKFRSLYAIQNDIVLKSRAL